VVKLRVVAYSSLGKGSGAGTSSPGTGSSSIQLAGSPRASLLTLEASAARQGGGQKGSRCVLGCNVIESLLAGGSLSKLWSSDIQLRPLPQLST
jgi:hypothetical protein